MVERTRTILLVDDTVANLEILVELLADFDVVEATAGEEALTIVAREKVDLILLDIMMPGIDGYTVCRRLKENAATAEIPIIFITAVSDEEAIEKAYDAGAIDYVTKPFKPKELLARVRIQLEHLDLIEKLEFLASHDPMTGIYNRRKFFELGLKAFAGRGAGLCAVMLDIDHFKKINDSYGHPTGDRVIREIVKAIAAELDPEVIFGRLGGEEFALLCHRWPPEELFAEIESLRQKIENLVMVADNGDFFHCTISAGIAACDDNTGNLDELLKRADARLYQAKGGGRNRSIFRG
ncbi:MAG: diguanylate cyclase [Deltaproteobacteria bacterium]|nr:diguanylate cyclase [Deltaproteobacteria bacterium]